MLASLYSAAAWSWSSVSPGLTWVNSTGCSLISMLAVRLARHGEPGGREIAGILENRSGNARRGNSRAFAPRAQ